MLKCFVIVMIKCVTIVCCYKIRDVYPVTVLNLKVTGYTFMNN